MAAGYPRRRLSGNQEKAAIATMEERQALVKHGNASQDLRRQRMSCEKPRGGRKGKEAAPRVGS